MIFIKDKETVVIPDNENMLLYALGINYIKHGIKSIGYLILSNTLILALIALAIYFIDSNTLPIPKHNIYVFILIIYILNTVVFTYFAKKVVIYFMVYARSFQIKVSSKDEKESLKALYKLTDDCFIEK